MNKRLEALRADGHIGAGLDAEVDVWCDGALAEALESVGDELRFVLITSAARVHPASERPGDVEPVDLGDGLSAGIRVAASSHPKCVRCWHRREDVGASDQHPELCGRCVQNVDGSGETRLYA